jgi:AraC-like DNA-binding protein
MAQRGAASPSTVHTAWTGALLRAVEARGIDPAELLVDAGIGADLLADPDRRLPLPASTRLWAAAVDATGDDGFGIDVSRHVRPTTFHALGNAFLSSPTLRAALERTARYSRVTADVAAGTTRFEGSEMALVIGWRPDADRPAFEAVDAALSSIVRSARFLLGRELSPVRVELERSAPSDVERFETFYRCPVRFGAAENVLAFDRADVERPVPGGNDRLAAASEQVLVEYLAGLRSDTVADRVSEVVVDSLADCEPGVNAVAAELAMSPRTLQRRLGEEGTTFRQVLAGTRLQLAEALLADDELSVTAVAHRLGFSETAAFSRAFRRWTGVSPSDRQRAG